MSAVGAFVCQSGLGVVGGASLRSLSTRTNSVTCACMASIWPLNFAASSRAVAASFREVSRSASALAMRSPIRRTSWAADARCSWCAWSAASALARGLGTPTSAPRGYTTAVGASRRTRLRFGWRTEIQQQIAAAWVGARWPSCVCCMRRSSDHPGKGGNRIFSRLKNYSGRRSRRAGPQRHGDSGQRARQNLFPDLLHGNERRCEICIFIASNA